MRTTTIVKLALSVLVVVAGVTLVVRSTAGSASHYFMVDDLYATGDLGQWKGVQMKVHGTVVPASVQERVVAQETIRTFVLEMKGKRIRVFNRGPKPDTFKDQAEVVATGLILPRAELASFAASLDTRIEPEMAYVVDATDLMAKCPGHYEGARANKDFR